MTRAAPLTRDARFDGAALAAALIESDALYFEIGAAVEPLHGASLACMAGLEDTAPGAVVQRIESEVAATSPVEWIEQIEAHLRARGCALSRLYLQAPCPALEAHLAHRGYKARREVGLATPLRTVDVSTPLATVMTPCESHRDWQRKLDMHRAGSESSDGRTILPERWVEMERRKCDTGRMQMFLAQRDGIVCGTVGLIQLGSLCRLKNVYVHPAHRRQGVASDMIRLMTRVAKQQHARLGIWAVDPSVGSALYRKLGLPQVITQTEWIKPIGDTPG